MNGMVHDWDSESKLSDQFINDYVQSFTRAFGKEVSILPRTFLKNFIFILEAAKSEPISKIKSLLNISEEQIEAVNKQIEIYGKEKAVEIEL